MKDKKAIQTNLLLPSLRGCTHPWQSQRHNSSNRYPIIPAFQQNFDIKILLCYYFIVTISTFIDLNHMSYDCCKNNNSKKDLYDTALFLKTVSEENRLRILCILKEEEKCVCEIWKELDIPQNLASHHLKVLKDSNLLSCRKEGLKTIYSINQDILEKHFEILSKFLSHKTKL